MNKDVFSHDPVMIDEVVHYVEQHSEGVFVDMTLGGAGHATRLLESFPDLKLIGIDQDPLALAVAGERLQRFGDRVALIGERFDIAAQQIAEHLDGDPLIGFLADLGVSSPQLDHAERGFSYMQAGPLDMRMDTTATRTAEDIINNYTAYELQDVLQTYGDERFAKLIARRIVEQRPLTTTTQLADLVANSIPAGARRKMKGHPAKRTFQAIRIEVNGELEILRGAIIDMCEALAPGGTGLVLTYHSGEDRIVKDAMRKLVSGDAPAGLPVITEYDWLFRGAKTATIEEIERNSRAKSARLRGITRLAPPANITQHRKSQDR